MDLDRIAGDVVLEAIDFSFDLGAGDETADFAHQQLDDGIFACGKSRRSPLVGDYPLSQVEDHIADGQLRVEAAVNTAGDGPQPRGQLFDVEGIHPVIVGARVDSGDAVGESVARGCDHHRSRAAALAHPAQHPQPITGGQPQIQHHGAEA
jgi:hypothetical protein